MAIIKKHDGGEKMVNVARTFMMNRSTVGTIYKSKDRIMEHVKSAVPMQSTIISKKRGKLIEETEELLSLWMKHQWQRRVRLSLTLIQEKAKSLFEDLKAKAGEGADKENFAAARAGSNASRNARTCIMFLSPVKQRAPTLRLPKNSQLS